MDQAVNAAPEWPARTNVLGVGISSLDMDRAVWLLLEARRFNRSGYVCVTGVHGVIESQRDPELKQIHNRSFLTVPDGMPTVWMGREQGFTRMGRVYGPDLMLRLMAATAVAEGCGPLDGGCSNLKASNPELHSAGAERPLTHFLYGATEEILTRLKSNLEARLPGVRIVGTYAPPFRPLTDEEEAEVRQIVADCKPDFFWVGLSTPKQERFMAQHVWRLNSKEPELQTSNLKPYPLDCGIMLGVGAAFPIHAGLQKDAPEWIKNSGLQWLYRLCQDPRRLWRRYLDIVPKFLWLSALQLLGIKRYWLK